MSIDGEYSGKIFDTDLNAVAATYIHWRLPGLGSRVAVTRILRFLIGIGRRATITTLCVDGIWQSFEDRLPIVIYTGPSFLSPEKFERCIPSDMTIKGTSVSPTLSVDLTLVSM